MAKPVSPSSGPSGGAYTVIGPNGLTCATVRDFVVVGGLSTDRYAIQWCAIGDPTDWPTPGTDDARANANLQRGIGRGDRFCDSCRPARHTALGSRKPVPGCSVRVTPADAWRGSSQCS